MPNATTSELSQRCRHCGAALDPASSFCSKCGATVELPGNPGDELGASLQALFGRELEIQGELGRGGMAAVYGAFDPVLQRRVAVKVLLPELAAEPGMANKFLQEARTVASLQHPHDRDGNRDRHLIVHEPGAAHGAVGDRGHRPVRVRRDGVRGPDGRSAVQGNVHGGARRASH